jgi:hypothetical protein
MTFTTQIAIAATLLTGLVTGVSAQTPASYPMVCRGGPNMFVSAKASNTPRAHVVVTIGFRPATAGASQRMPAGGECTWADRALHPNEPRKLMLVDEGARFLETRCTQGQCRLRTSSGTTSQLLQWAIGGYPFQVSVYNDNQGHLRITRVGP